MPRDDDLAPYRLPARQERAPAFFGIRLVEIGQRFHEAVEDAVDRSDGHSRRVILAVEGFETCSSKAGGIGAAGAEDVAALFAAGVEAVRPVEAESMEASRFDGSLQDASIHFRCCAGATQEDQQLAIARGGGCGHREVLTIGRIGLPGIGRFRSEAMVG